MIWCIEDDAGIRELEIYTLESTGFQARGFADSEPFWEALEIEKPELILLDIMLPGEDGISILKKLKGRSDTSSIPVIMATAKGMEIDKVQSLDGGADDYLVKPFGMMEMVSRIKAVLRRCGKSPEKDEQNIKQDGSIVLDESRRLVTVDGNPVELTYKEFEMLGYFLSHPGMAVTREQIYEQVWGDAFLTESRTVDMHIRTLRQKLGNQGSRIQTVRNVGYRWEAAK